MSSSQSLPSELDWREQVRTSTRITLMKMGAYSRGEVITTTTHTCKGHHTLFAMNRHPVKAKTPDKKKKLINLGLQIEKK